jgi:hypothetical protein
MIFSDFVLTKAAAVSCVTNASCMQRTRLLEARLTHLAGGGEMTYFFDRSKTGHTRAE